MKKTFSLRTLIDDILLLVRNNNISESEDLSRAQIASWVLAYRAALIKQYKDKDADNVDATDTSLTELLETKTELELIHLQSKDGTPICLRRTKELIPSLLDNDERNIFSVTDQEGCILQFMDDVRKHFHKFRKYTYGELTWYYENGYIYVQGTDDYGMLKYINVRGLFSHEEGADADEDEVAIPEWMVPDIKERILRNELSFMLQRISDDDNNSTLDGIKPQSQAVIPNEK